VAPEVAGSIPVALPIIRSTANKDRLSQIICWDACIDVCATPFGFGPLAQLVEQLTLTYLTIYQPLEDKVGGEFAAARRSEPSS
jgi:hypothetical protein